MSNSTIINLIVLASVFTYDVWAGMVAIASYILAYILVTRLRRAESLELGIDA